MNSSTIVISNNNSSGTVFPPDPPSDEMIKKEELGEKRINKGNGIFDYIESSLEREMFENAWQAINLTETWDFVSQDIESFMMSTDRQICTITNMMEQLGYCNHSGFTFGFTMRRMQYLATHGEEEFKKLYVKA